MDKIFDAIEFLDEGQVIEAENVLIDEQCTEGKEIFNKIR